jgi:hypothetical protein
MRIGGHLGRRTLFARGATMTIGRFVPILFVAFSPCPHPVQSPDPAFATRR